MTAATTVSSNSEQIGGCRFEQAGGRAEGMGVAKCLTLWVSSFSISRPQVLSAFLSSSCANVMSHSEVEDVNTRNQVQVALLAWEMALNEISSMSAPIGVKILFPSHAYTGSTGVNSCHY